jgi:polysaccharide pyruvyl transferase WcaK-like protein
MVQTTIAAIRRLVPHVSFSIISQNEDIQQAFRHISRTFPDARLYKPLVPPFKRINKFVPFRYPAGLLWSLVIGAKFVKHSLFSIGRKNQRPEVFRECDFVLLQGGPVLYEWRPILWPALVFHLYPILLARCYGIPYSIHGSTVPSFGKDRLARWFIRWLFNGARSIAVRETQSKNELMKCGLSESAIQLIPDPAFLIGEFSQQYTDKSVLQRYKLTEYNFIAVTLRPLRNIDLEQYVHEIRKLLILLKEEGEEIVIVVQSRGPSVIEDDRIIIREVMADKLLQDMKVIDDDLSPWDVAEIYSKARLLIAIRYHSMVFAISRNTPVVAISYSDKAKLVLSDLGLEDLCLDITEFQAERCIAVVRKCLQERQRIVSELTSISQRLKQRLIAYYDGFVNNDVLLDLGNKKSGVGNVGGDGDNA